MQGNPLSPLLFVLVMGYLSRSLKIASATPSFKYHPRCKRLELVHLMFADDLLLFWTAELQSVQGQMKAFQVFSNTTGLAANYNKSEIVIRRCDP